MFDAMDSWHSGEWWLFFTALLLAMAYVLCGIVSSAPAWVRRLRRLEDGRRRQAELHDPDQRAWFDTQRSVARQWIRCAFPDYD